MITQREIGFDTLNFQNALKNTLRQAPDVILIGEIRDTETMEAAITFAETGHLCIGTLHSNNANQAIERIMNFFPVERHAQIYLQLSLNLRAIISQRLIPSLDNKRVPALEIMLDTPRIKDLIRKAEIDTLKEAMEQGIDEGCQTFDHVLFNLYKEEKISLEQALINADSANNLRLKIKIEGLKGDDAVNALLDKHPSSSQSDAFKIQGGGSGNVTYAITTSTEPSATPTVQLSPSGSCVVTGSGKSYTATCSGCSRRPERLETAPMRQRTYPLSSATIGPQTAARRSGSKAAPDIIRFPPSL